MAGKRTDGCFVEVKPYGAPEIEVRAIPLF